jgi:hypothetical protein
MARIMNAAISCYFYVTDLPIQSNSALQNNISSCSLFLTFLILFNNYRLDWLLIENSRMLGNSYEITG